MPDERLLRVKARAAVESGKLPLRRPDRSWGVPGVGTTCAVCDEPVTKGQSEIEIHFVRDGDNPGLDRFHLHMRCFAAWEFERRQDGGEPHR